MDSGNILCVDDDTTVLTALRTLLTQTLGSDYMVEIAESGAEALEIVDEIQAAGEQLTIVISDFIMPGMHGDEFLIQLHQRSPATITIMLTGQSDFDGVKKAINQANLYRFLEKPFNNDDIILTIKSACEAYHKDQMLLLKNQQMNQLNTELNQMLCKVQESERLLEQRVAQRTLELDQKNTELKHALRSLEDVERIARHDLKTPLVSISAAPNLLRAGRVMAAHEEIVLNMIESASSRALSMVNLSLDLFRMESGSYVFHPARVDLTALVLNIAMGLSAHAQSKSVKIIVPENQPPVHVAADDSLCYSIIGNLCKNAVEAAPDHSEVQICIIDGPIVSMTIHNQGTVPLALRDNFFAKYSTSGKAGGTGLGTYSSHLLACVQGGSLTMQTSEEHGTTLSLCLNRAEAIPVLQSPGQDSTQSSDINQSAEQDLAGFQVLLVDDDDFNQMVMSEYIPQPPIHLETAINGRLALEFVLHQRPDIIIMDIEMPVMGGIEAMQAIRQHQQQSGQVPSMIVAYSGNDDEASQSQYLSYGFDACLSKPSSREDVLSLLSKVNRLN